MHFLSSVALFTLFTITASSPFPSFPSPNERELLTRASSHIFDRSILEHGPISALPEIRRGILDKLKDLGESVKQEAEEAVERAKQAAQEVAERAKKEAEEAAARTKKDAEDAAEQLKNELEKIKITPPTVEIAP